MGCCQEYGPLFRPGALCRLLRGCQKGPLLLANLLTLNLTFGVPLKGKWWCPIIILYQQAKFCRSTSSSGLRINCWVPNSFQVVRFTQSKLFKRAWSPFRIFPDPSSVDQKKQFQFRGPEDAGRKPEAELGFRQVACTRVGISRSPGADAGPGRPRPSGDGVR